MRRCFQESCSFCARLLLAIAVLVSAFGLRVAQAAPADPFTGASQGFDAAPEEGVNYKVGDWGVSDQRGAAIYTFPIAVPPG
jgi:hypothetical protein